MKKKLSFVLCMLMFFPCLMFFASCSQPSKYEISVKSSDNRYGTTNLVDGEYTEGKQVKLKASPLGSSKFLCWAHNLNKIVSNNTEYTVTINENTKGQYTAIFDTECKFYAVTEVELLSELENFSVKIETGLAPSSLISVYEGDGSKELPTLNYENIGVGFYNKYLVSKPSSATDYYCKVSLTADGQTTIKFLQDAVSLFKQPEKTFTTTIENIGEISIKFTALNETIISQILA